MAALEKAAEDLVDLGARRERRFEPGEVMSDPEGNEFCLD